MPTVYRDLGVTKETVPEMDTFLAGEFPRAEAPCLVISGTAALVRGQILISSGAGVAPYTGTGTIVGVLGVDTPAATGGDVPAFMYKTGEFNEDKLVGLDAAGRTALQALNIYARRVD
jgi:hypothetical protein